MNRNEKLFLKEIERSDAPIIFELTDRSRSFLRTWLPWVDGTTTQGDTKKFIEISIKAAEAKKGQTWVVHYEGEAAGVISYNQIDWQQGIAYIGYWLGEGHLGKGIMTEAVKALIDNAFNELKMNKVDIRAAAGNTKSRAIPERLGFLEEGKLREAELLNGEYVSHVVYGLLKREWQTASADS